MKKLFVLVFLLTNYLLSFTQTEFAPIGAEWYYTLGEGMSSPSAGYYLLKSIKDSTIDSKACKILSHTGVSSKGISYNDGQSIVYHNTKENKVYRYLYSSFYLLYDFSLVTADTIVIKEPYSAIRYDSIVSVVDSVVVETLPNNIRLKALYLKQISQGEYFFTGKIIENIGNLYYFFPWFQFSCDSRCSIPLRCYFDSNLSFKRDTRPCDAVYPYTKTEIAKTLEISVFPNPFISSFTFRNIHSNGQKLSIDILNVYGQSIRHEVISDNMDHAFNLNGYPSGLYFLVVKAGNTNISYKIFKSTYFPD